PDLALPAGPDGWKASGMIKIVDRYVGLAAMQGTLLILVGLTLLYMMMSALAEIRGAEAGYGVGDALWFVIWTTPRMAYQIFPFAALLGVLVGVGSLAGDNELVAFRTSGVSRMRLAAAALGGAMVLAIPIVIIGEWVAPEAEYHARAFRMSESGEQAIVGGDRGMWLRDGGDIINIQLPLLSANREGQQMEFKDVVIYGFSESSQLQSITRAENASHDGSLWRLDDVTTVRFRDRAAVVESAATQTWPTEVRPELLDSAVTRPPRLSMRALWGYLDYLRENGLDDTVYQGAFWEKVFYPLVVVALVLAGMPFVFGSSRSHNLGVRMFIGMMLGGLFVILSRGLQNFGDAYAVPAILTYSMPALLLGGGAIFVLRKTV
ncbi:MAG: LPS export ABC transporter permease LptG, partial [Xanthomonadales bacterium]|nr:LPS export ABC transporter permease LptG [Xanthomonadales bacterium]